MQKKSYQLFDKMVLPCLFMLSNIKLYVFWTELCASSVSLFYNRYRE